jgi:hypothetical protein
MEIGSLSGGNISKYAHVAKNVGAPGGVCTPDVSETSSETGPILR